MLRPDPVGYFTGRRFWGFALGITLTAFVSLTIFFGYRKMVAQPQETPKVNKPDALDVVETIMAPELEGGVAWINTPHPLKLKDLRGKIVLMDFWTLCCINCIHTMPDLAKLEKKYANELVVIGIHSPKFENEKDTNSIRKAVLRYEIHHPVLNDANQKVWTSYEINSWPSIVLIDPEGKLVGVASGEGLFEILDKTIAQLIEKHRKNKTLNEQPLRFDTAAFRAWRDRAWYGCN